MLARLALVLGCCLVALALSACDSDAPPSAPNAPAVSAPPSTGATIGPMPLEVRRSELPPDFPVEIPVPDGRVISAEQQSPDVWVYELAVGAPVGDVAAYYEQLYTGANWAVASRSSDGPSVRLLFVKGNAEATVDATPDEAGSRAVVAVGLGVPVGSTY